MKYILTVLICVLVLQAGAQTATPVTGRGCYDSSRGRIYQTSGPYSGGGTKWYGNYFSYSTSSGSPVPCEYTVTQLGGICYINTFAESLPGQGFATNGIPVDVVNTPQGCSIDGYVTALAFVVVGFSAYRLKKTNKK